MVDGRHIDTNKQENRLLNFIINPHILLLVDLIGTIRLLKLFLYRNATPPLLMSVYIIQENERKIGLFLCHNSK